MQTAGFPHDHHYVHERHFTQNIGAPIHHMGVGYVHQPYIAAPGTVFKSQSLFNPSHSYHLDRFINRFFPFSGRLSELRWRRILRLKSICSNIF